MPQILTPYSIATSGPDVPTTIGDRIDFVLAFLRRRYLIILVCLLLSLPFGALYLLLTPASYTASSTMMIETRKNPLVDFLGADAPVDASWIESQIGVLKSQSVAAYVVKQLRLSDDLDFVRSAPSVFDKVLARIGWQASEPSQTEAERVAAATGAVMGGLQVQRLGLSYMLRIDFHSNNADRAAKIANAMIDGYIYDQLNAKYQANRRAGDWLQERLQALREQAAAAERAVVEFKAKNNIVKTGGTLMNEQELSDASSQLAAARAHTLDVQARLERIGAVRQAYQQDQPASAADEDIAEAVANPIIQRLRGQYLDMVNREADWSVRYGKNHNAVVNLRNQIRDIRKSIRDELGRIEETFRSEYQIAQKRQDEMEKGLTSLVSKSTETNQAQVTLFSLEAAAQSYRKLYDNFLNRHTESVQQQSFPISDARVVSPASVSKTGPRALQAWLLTIFGGGVLGFGLGAFREIMDRGFRTKEQVQVALATECLALLPALRNNRSAGLLSYSLSVSLPQLDSSRGSREEARLSVARQPGTGDKGHARKNLRAVVDDPSWQFAEAIRSIKLTLDLGAKGACGKVIGVTSCFASEGKSTVAAELALLMAQSGARVVLVDGDVRNPSLSRTFAPKARLGFLDVAVGGGSLRDAVLTDADTDMAFLPMVLNRRLPHATDILASDSARSLFASLQVEYDYVIVDLTPLISAIDNRAISRLIESYILVIEWGTTKVDAVQYALRNVPGVQEKILGAVLNKVNLARVGQYDSYGGAYYYGRGGNQARAVR